ncbi:MAG: CRISPR-associated endonuclease Cas2 [Saprospiraceae bacterium]
MYLIAYDIENDRLRTKTADQLLAAGCIRLQKSVFAGELDGALFKKVESWLKKNVNTAKYPDDKVLILDVGPETMKAMQWIGTPSDEWQLLTNPPDVLFL